MYRLIVPLALMLVATSAAADSDAAGSVCRGISPSCFSKWPRVSTGRYRILIYSKTGASRHANLGPVLALGLNPPLTEANVAQRELLRMANEQGWEADYTEDVAEMAKLKSYHAVVFLSTSREALDDAGKTALRQFMRAGGGFVGIHNAFGTLYNWPYYEALLGETNLYDHLAHRSGDVVVAEPGDPSMKGVPARFAFKDEWYNLAPFPTQVRFLATVDEASWPDVPDPRAPIAVGRHPGHGRFHPVAWCQYYDGGKVWVTTLGHDADAFRRNSTLPGAAAFQRMVVGGIRSVIGESGFCRGR